jgi:hypothetical protein
LNSLLRFGLPMVTGFPVNDVDIFIAPAHGELVGRASLNSNLHGPSSL